MHDGFWQANLVIALSAGDLATDGTRPSNHTVLSQKYSHVLIQFSTAINDFVSLYSRALLWLSLCADVLVFDGYTIYPKKYAHGFCFAVLCCGYTLTDFPISVRLTSLALWQCNDCPSASKATLMNMDKYFMWIHYERLHNHNKAKHNKPVCIFLGIYCRSLAQTVLTERFMLCSKFL